MVPLQTKLRSAIAVLAGVLLVLTGFSAPANAATARVASLKATPALQYAGSSVTFSGNVSKSGSGKVVKIQRKSGSTWVNAISTSTTSSTGTYAASITLPSTTGDYSYRAFAPKVGSYSAAYSSTVVVSALRHTTATMSASPTSIGTGASTTLSGSVTPFVAGSTVSIQKLTSGTWSAVTATSLSASGNYAASVSPSATSQYRAAISRVAFNAGTQSAATTVTVIPANPPVITTTTLPQGDKGIAYPTTTLTKTGGAGTWTISAGALPAGINLAAATGVLSGTPTAGGTANFTAKFTETSTNLSATKALSIVVTPPPAITTTSLPDATQGIAYSTTVNKTGNPGTWTISGLPSGLSINATTGEISGTTTAAAGLYGVYPVFTETGTGRSVLKPLGLTVLAGATNPPGGPTITTTTLPQGDKGIAYTTTLAKTGGAGTWTVNSGTLPAGLDLAAATGVIAGTPTAGGTANFTVKFTETSSGLSALKSFSLVITPPPSITTTTLPDATQGTAYSTTLAKTGNAGTWTITGLPTGLSLNAATGEISGTTTVAAGTYGVFPTFTETGTGRQAATSLALHVIEASTNPPGGPSITTSTLPDADKGVAYTTTLAKTGGAGVWSITGGALPAGITLTDAAAGTLAGTPTAGGTASFTVSFKETSSNKVAAKALTLLVTPPPTITTDTLPDATRGTPYTATLLHTGHPGTWALATSNGSNGLPAGLTFDGATGTVSGTVTGPTGTYGIFPTFTETGTGRQVFKPLALTVVGQDVAVTTTSVPDGTTGTAYSQQLTKTGGAGTWSLKTGSLPSGVTLSPGGLLAGTPTVSGDFGFNVLFTETGSGATDTQPLLLHVSAVGAPVITSTSLPDGTVGDAYDTNLTATGGGANGHWYVSYGFLPDGITIDGATGELSGTPTTAGDSAFIVTYETDTTSNTKALSIHVDEAATP